MLKSNQRKPMQKRLLLLLPVILCGCNSMPTFVHTEPPLIPALPLEARQPVIPSDCSPHCMQTLTALRNAQQKKLMPTESPDLPASKPTTVSPSTEVKP